MKKALIIAAALLTFAACRNNNTTTTVSDVDTTVVEAVADTAATVDSVSQYTITPQ